MSFDNLCIGKDYFSLQCLLPGVIALWIVLAFVEPKVACLLVHEDGIVQWLQVLFLLLTVLYCMLIVRSFGCNYDSKIIRNTFFLFLVLAILVMFEEISWGQRLLGIETPACISKVNVQNQITLHNLIGFQRVRHWLLIFLG